MTMLTRPLIMLTRHQRQWLRIGASLAACFFAMA